MRHYVRSQICRSAQADRIPLRPVQRIAAKWCGAILLGAVALAACSRQAVASVLTNGNVLPADNPFTPGIDEGIPIDGNFIDTTVGADKQITFEGSVDTKGDADPTNDTNVNFDVIVGQTSYGVLLISGESALRDENLIIGDSGKIGGASGVTRQGTGIVRITGFGSLYNNDPAIIPPGLPANFGSVVPRDPGIGYDLYVGKTGVGTLEISAGGRAQIQDAAVIGDQSGSSGTIIVDGIDSFLGNGGFNSGTTVGELHQMVIGHLGTGVMSITNGGQVFAIGPNPSSPAQFLIGAVIGSDPTILGQPIPFTGGQGAVTVDGVGSKWVIGGSLQVGGFNNDKFTNPPATQDAAGGTVQYPGNSGRGSVSVSNGAIVNVIPPTILTGQTNLDLDVLVGLYGQIHLAGGTIQIDNGAISTGGGSAIPSITTYRLLNDGTVGGSGTISVGQFRNRALGQVHVAASEKLVVNSTGQFGLSPAIDEELLSNYGLIDVLGTEQNRAEIDFNYTPTNVTGSNAVTRPFINFRPAPLTVINGGRQQGDIVGQSSTFRFQSGMENHGNFKFTGGTNIVSGNISNCAAGDPVCVGSTIGRGLILITGANTSVTFEDNVYNSGMFQIDSPNSPVTIDGNITFGANSQLITTLGSHISVAGNLIFSSAIAGTSFFSANLLDLNSLAVGQQFSFLTFSGSAVGISPGTLIGDQPIGNGLELQGRLFQNALQFVVCSNLGVCKAGGMLPPVNDADLNGDGIVNGADLAIWRARFGLMGLGDVNGDGIVDAADYTIIRDHFGLPMGAGAGVGSGSAVPEPSSLMLLAVGAVLALAAGRRRCLAI
jgi:T5SS/PEP-CTERM-associated repeat protein